jgi:CMP-N,N'-diacetyllegionaminic acid synthase
MVVAIVTARKNSKGLPKKNILDLGGIPLIQHSFDVAIQSKVFDKVILTSDFEDAIEIAKSIPGVEVPFIRPKSLCGPEVSQFDVVKHVVDYYSSIGEEISHFVLLQPTSPFRKIEEVVSGVKLLIDGNKSVLGVSRVMHHPADYLIKDEDNKIRYLMPEYASKPRQSFPPVFFNNGAFYGVESNFFLEKKVFYDENSILLEMSEDSLIDIDTEFEYRLAKGLLIKN